MKQLALAVNNYENKFNIFPPAYINGSGGGAPNAGDCVTTSTWRRQGGFSWRVLILPDVEEQNLYNALDFDSSVNPNVNSTCGAIEAAATAANLSAVRDAGSIQAFLCPSDDTLSDVAGGNKFGSNYAALCSIKLNHDSTTNISSEGNFAASASSYLTELGVMHFDAGRTARQRDVANDGTSSTIMIVEVDRQGFVYGTRAGGYVTRRCGYWYTKRGCLADGFRTPDDFGTVTDTVTLGNTSEVSPTSK